MIVQNEPYLIEYNVRMGDPECQTILPKLKTDLLDIILACTQKNWLRLKLIGIIKIAYVLFCVQRLS